LIPKRTTMSDTAASHDSETPAHGQQVFTACAFIHRVVDGVPKVFMARRAATKKFFPDVYELPGGHIDYGEDLKEGLKREVREELQADITVGDPFAVFTYLNDVKGSHSIEVIYFAQLTGGPDSLQLNPADHSTAGWFAADEITGLLAENDDELPNILKGFALLAGEPHEF
jgi:8-oxo-dGTP diphosphatase